MKEALCSRALPVLVFFLLLGSRAAPLSGQAIAPVDSVTTDSLATDSLATMSSSSVSDTLEATERARRHLQEREFVEAYQAAEEAASEVGLPPSSGNLAIPDSIAGADAASILLYRGLALELQRQFPQAAADYYGFLKLEPNSPRSLELRKRLPYVEAQSIRTLARQYRDEGVLPPIEAFENGARFSLGVFPLFNESSLLAMSQMAFGLTGVLRNTLSMLDAFADRPLPSVPYAHVRWVLDEILPQEVYAETETIPATELSRVLDTEFLVLGRLNEVVGSLTANLVLGRAGVDESTTVGEVQSSYSQAGLQSLQMELALALADSIQSITGFEFIPSRQAYADSIQDYLIPDVERFFDYGYAMEQLLIGDPVEGRILLMDIDLPLAQRDLPEVGAVFSGDTPPADNLFELTATLEELQASIQAAYEDSVAAAEAAAADSLAALTTNPPVVEPVRRSRRTAREVVVVSATADRVLGPAGVNMPRLDVFYTPSSPIADPRAGKSGTLDPTRHRPGVPVRIEIPIPRGTQSTDSSKR